MTKISEAQRPEAGNAAAAWGMRRGAFVMIDALGFKGIWRREDVRREPLLILDKLEQLAGEAKSFAETWGKRSTGFGADRIQDFETTLLSDTIAAGISVSQASPTKALDVAVAANFDPDVWALLFSAIFVNRLLRKAADGLPLAFRGSIAWGPFMMRRRCMVGPAVDEASEVAQQAEAAVVFLAPSALQAVEGLAMLMQALSMPLSALLLRWQVPIKGGASYETFVVSPFSDDDDEPTRSNYWSALERSFDRTRLDVEIKRQNTKRFIQAANAHVGKVSTALAQLSAAAPPTAQGQTDGPAAGPPAKDS